MACTGKRRRRFELLSRGVTASWQPRSRCREGNTFRSFGGTIGPVILAWAATVRLTAITMATSFDAAGIGGRRGPRFQCNLRSNGSSLSAGTENRGLFGGHWRSGKRWWHDLPPENYTIG